MQRNTLITISTILALPILVLLGSVLLSENKGAQEAIVDETDASPLYSVRTESPEADIEVGRTGYVSLDNWLKNKATEIHAQYTANAETSEGMYWQKPRLHMRSSSAEWSGYINVVLDVYEYVGGAHGYQYVETVVANKATGDVVGLGDVFGADEYLPKLSRLMMGKVSDLNEVFDGEVLRAALVPSATNFERWSVGTDGVTFFYNPYEVAPYNVGIVSVLVTWEEIEKFK